MRSTGNRKKTILALVVVAVLLAALLSAYLFLRPGTSAGSKILTVHVRHLTGADSTFTVKTDAEFLRGALEAEKMIAGSETAYGLWVETVDGETADAGQQEWWGYQVNGEMAVYGVDEQPVSDGDVIDFTLNVGY